jgi:CheY-like chemotaxis protein
VSLHKRRRAGPGNRHRAMWGLNELLLFPQSALILFAGDRDALRIMRNQTKNFRRCIDAQGADQSFEPVRLKVEVFGSATEMLQSKLPDVASCLVLDIRLPGLSGLDFQTELAKAHIPIIFMTGHGTFR